MTCLLSELCATLCGSYIKLTLFDPIKDLCHLLFP